MSDIEEAKRSGYEVTNILEQNEEIDQLINRTKLKYPDLPDWITSWLNKKIMEIVRKDTYLNRRIKEIYDHYNIYVSEHCTDITTNALFKDHLLGFIEGQLIE